VTDKVTPIGTAYRHPSGAASVEEALNAFSLFREYFQGAIGVDAEARITWIDARYRKLLKLPDDFDPNGLPVEEVIPHSLMRQVVETGRPMLLDIMDFDDRQFVVCRFPIRDDDGVLQGAAGFVFYDNVDHLQPILKKLETLKTQLNRARAALSRERQTKYSLANFIGASEVVKDLKAQIRRFALRDGPALILGETGTGKELLAHAIHQSSDRAEGPFVAVNMAAVPESLLESEFFGTAPGAFTGAEKKARKGKFELAHGGTLFLDEIGDMPLALQAKFLRVLQEGEIEPLGSNSIKKIDVRVISATSQDLDERLQNKTFRADLYYRLAVLTVNVPPLRERLDDMPVLAERLLEEVPRMADMPAWEIAADAIAVLQNHDWPGNVRELGNVLERAAAMARDEHLDADLIAKVMPKRVTAGSVTAGSGLADAVAGAEKRAIVEALAAAKGQKTAAAESLGVSRSQFYEKLKRYDLG